MVARSVAGRSNGMSDGRPSPTEEDDSGDVSLSDLHALYEFESARVVQLQAEMVVLQDLLRSAEEKVKAREDELTILRADLTSGDPLSSGMSLHDPADDQPGESLLSSAADPNVGVPANYQRTISRKNDVIKSLRRELARVLRRVASLQTTHELFQCHVRSERFVRLALDAAALKKRREPAAAESTISSSHEVRFDSHSESEAAEGDVAAPRDRKRNRDQ